MNLENSKSLQARADQLMPGGVNSPVRSFRAVGGTPPWMAAGAGAYLTDVDGNRYLDYIGSWGALLFGHAPAELVAAVSAAVRNGASFGASTPRELELAELLCALVPGLEMVRMVNSGTEATMSAVRVARGFTGRAVVVKFEGCYHGHADFLLVKAGSGVATLGLASSAGVPPGGVADTLVLPYNDADAVRTAFAAHGPRIAAVIVEAVAGNMGCVPPLPGFLEALRDQTRSHGAVLIFDEVMTGFRVASGGAAARYGIMPDLFTFGKIIGGGLPVGAYGGRAEIMRKVAPLGPVYQAGTLSGNPLAMAAGIAALGRLRAEPDLYAELEERGARLERGLRGALEATATIASVQRVGSMFTLFFGRGPLLNFADVGACDLERFGRFHAAMLEAGVLLPPSQFEAAFLGTAHGPAEIDFTVAAAEQALRASA